jgi:ABC-type amino acid transport substrate-binding protein
VYWVRLPVATKRSIVGERLCGFFVYQKRPRPTTEETGRVLLHTPHRKRENRMRKIAAWVLVCAFALGLTGCGSSSSSATKTGLEDGVLTVAMECAYAPYNWTQSTDANGAVPIKGSSDYANGYDVMMAKKIADALGVELEIVRSDWDSLVPAVQTGTVDAVIAGQSMTPERSEQVDFAGPYFYASIVCLTKANSPYANAKGLSDLAGASATAQIATIWYDTCLPQINGITIQTASESAPAMLMALETGTVDFVCTDLPTAQGALVAYPDLVVLDFTDNATDNFVVDDGDINIGISIRKGNTELKDAINSVLDGMTAADFTDLMAQAIAIQPIGA